MLLLFKRQRDLDRCQELELRIESRYSSVWHGILTTRLSVHLKSKKLDF